MGACLECESSVKSNPSKNETKKVSTVELKIRNEPTDIDDNNIKSLEKDFSDLKLDTLDGLLRKCKIVDVYDGDTYTIVFNLDGKPRKRKFRIYGIDTPELKPKKNIDNHDIHKRAGEICRDIVKDKFQDLNNIVWIHFMKAEKYGREMGIIYYSNAEKWDDSLPKLADILVQEKLALAYDGGTK